MKKNSQFKLSLLMSAILLSVSSIASHSAFAQEGVTGLWKSIDDKTGNPKALIRITESNGELTGKIEKLFRAPDLEQNPKCEKCEGASKGQPLIGLTILTGLKKDGDEYSGGKILDPENGKLYSSKLSLNEGKLNVRGFIGMPLLGRSQTWLREP